MSTPLIVSNDTFQFPENRDSAGWGEEVTAWAKAVTDVLANITGVGDIQQTAAVILNNQVGAVNVVGLNFDPTTVRGAVIEFSIYRTSSLEEKVEVGTIYAGHKSTTNTWDFVVVGSAGSGVTLSITTAGQVQYLSDNMTGTGYSGTMKFRARSLTV